MATCFVICMAGEDEEDHTPTMLAVAPTEAAAEKELLRQAELHQAKWSTPKYRPGILIAGPMLLSVGNLEFYFAEVPLVS